MNTSEGHITISPSAPPPPNNIYGNPYPPPIYQEPPQPRQSQPQREQIIVQVPQNQYQVNGRPRQQPVQNDSSLSIYVATCCSIFFPIIGLFYITIYLCCIRGNEEITERENNAFKILCGITFFSIFFYLLIGIFSS